MTVSTLRRWSSAAAALTLAAVPVPPAVAHRNGHAGAARLGEAESGGFGPRSAVRPARTGWRSLPPSPLARTEVGAAAVGRFVYVVGGFGNAGAPSDEVERYDTRRRRWTLVAPLPSTLNHPAVVGHRGRLYVLGGYTNAPLSPGPVFDGSADVSRSFFVYRPERDAWQRLPDLPRPRAAGAAAVIGHRLYLAGGVGFSYRALPEVEAFNLRAKRWTRAPDLRLPADHVAGTAARGAFYVLGGRPAYGGQNYAYAQRYRPGDNRWRRLPDMTRGHAGFGAVTVCGRVVALGGEQPGDGPTGTIDRVEQYDPQDREWSRLPDLSMPRHGLGVARVGRHIYAIEGGTVTLVGISNVVESLAVKCRERTPTERRGSRRRP